MMWFNFILGCYFIFLFLNNPTLPYPKTKGEKFDPKKNLNHICAHLITSLFKHEYEGNKSNPHFLNSS